MQSREKLAAGIYLVTDPGLSMERAGLPARPDLSEDVAQWHQEAIKQTVNLVKAACSAGVKVVQLRWKNVDAAYFLQLATQTAAVVPTQTQLFINDRVDVFLAGIATGLPLSGVHIGQSDLPPALVRELLGPHPLIGWSASTVEEIAKAQDLGTVIDYLGVGVVHATATKEDAPSVKGTDQIAQIARQVDIPIVAIGGIKTADIPQIAATQIHSAAIVSAIVCADKPAQVAKELDRLFFAHRTDPER